MKDFPLNIRRAFRVLILLVICTRNGNLPGYRCCYKQAICTRIGNLPGYRRCYKQAICTRIGNL